MLALRACITVPMNTSLSDWRSAAVEAARLGAAELEYWRGRFSVREKARADLVTDADHASQKAVQALLRSLPGPRLPRRGGARRRRPGGPTGRAPTWIVDPLDGTANYVHDVPAYCVSVGLWAGGDLVVGVIYDPRQRRDVQPPRPARGRRSTASPSG